MTQSGHWRWLRIASHYPTLLKRDIFTAGENSRLTWADRRIRPWLSGVRSLKDDVSKQTEQSPRAYRTSRLIGLLVLLCDCLPAYAEPLDLDQTFKGTGTVVT